MRCEWIEEEKVCGVVCTSLSCLNQHLSEHLDRFLLSLNNEQEESLHEYTCPWSNCKYNTHTNIPALLSSHVYFHGFHLSLQVTGSKYIRHKGLPSCHTPNSDLTTIIPNIRQLHRCEWNDDDPECKQEFMFPAEFYSHVWEHATCAVSTANNELECRWKQCKYKTAKRSSLRTHLRMHTQEKTIACPNCYKLFATNPCLEDHLHRQAPPSSLYACDICRKQFSTERLLKSHLNKHINNKQCSLCGFTLPDDSHLLRHMLFKHNDKRTHFCSVCDKSFKTEDVLKRHLVLHLKAPDTEISVATEGKTKVYMCHLCDKKFVHCSYLGRHLSNYHKLKRGTLRSSSHKFKFVQQRDGFYKLADRNFPPPSLAKSLSYRCHVCDLRLPEGKCLSQHLIQTHEFSLPKGYSKFRYHKNAEGFHELVMFRIESKTLHSDN